MINTIKCPYCQKEIELSEALTDQIREEQKQEIEKNFEQKLREKILAEQELKIKDKENEAEELKKRNRELGNQLLELNKSLRLLREKDEERELKSQKQIFDEIEKAKENLAQKINEENRLKNLEKDKQIADLKKVAEELKRKAEQGSEQAQGEILELDLENSLRNVFPQDEILEVKKGVRGADLVQLVKTPMGNIAGKIIWENKRTKNWENKWIDKLRSDQRVEKARFAGLVSMVLPKDAPKEIIPINKVWVTTPKYFIALATFLRNILLEGAKQKAISAQSASTAEELYEYLNSHEFTQQMEAIAESYFGMQEQIIKEKVAFETQWKRREVQLNKMFKSLFNIYGGITGIAGPNFPQIKGLEMLEESKNDKDKLI
ncbi:MAG: hypothetical protein CEN89_236 [Candidatus Berkelbacteria bacterium Licking1014_7]|uniref:DUF2130 domain-containing protein n=1 Tax=Candidatus Berkelbacteria bacterium Licking1014_7 TaxID=2017147 RepID=A0A554LK18_9BACT|nr:MAG: hypothetical protein CEN89_236 [Candidatus Berkelbacteria bacterium Licking1014_7]